MIEVWRGAVRASVLVVLGCGIAAAQAGVTGRNNDPGGHEEQVMVDPSLHRFMGTVTAVGAPDAKGRIYTFELSPVGKSSKAPAPNEFRGWQLKMLSGKRFPDTFEVSGNTASQVTVVSSKSPIDGVGVHDMFIVESIDATGNSIFAPTGQVSQSHAQ